MSHRNRYFTVVAFVCAIAGIAADESEESSPQSGKPAVLLFRSGRSLEGLVSETETNYVLHRPVGRLEVPKSDVEFVASDLTGIYRYKLSKINDRDAEEHIRVAQWCMLVKLYDEAIAELERAVELSAKPSRAQAMLEAARRTARTTQRAIPPTANHSSSPPADLDLPKREAISSEVSPELLSTFSVQIQPMLTRSCATSGCHDTSHTGPLVLLRSPRPVPKVTHHNLRAILNQIRYEEPDRSPLLTHAIRPHGSSSHSPFLRGASDPAFETLAAWILAVTGPPSPAALVVETAPSTESGDSNVRSDTVPPSKPSDDDLRQITIERAIGEMSSKLDELAGSGRVYSNKPIMPTPSRIRAGMVAAPSQPPQTATIGPPPTAGSSRPNLSTTPPRTGSSGHHADPPTSEAKAPSTPLKSPRSESDSPQVAPAPSPASTHQHADPFDPEIFNRQFAPRPD